MNLKRDAQGVVDGIVAEDIGKFPDTNLAESLQRISGVSIDRSHRRRLARHGSRRRPGLQPGAAERPPDAGLEPRRTRAPRTRAPSTSRTSPPKRSAAIEVYKTSRADTPTGGIGATINIKTARPLDTPGLHTSFGVKGVIRHVGRQPAGRPARATRSRRKSPASSATPSRDDTLRRRAHRQLPGARLSASTRRRSATAGARSPATRTTGARFRSRARRARRTSPTVPMPTDTYSVPQNLGYSVNGIERKRTNGQLTLQFAPVDSLTATLDYTYSENKIAARSATSCRCGSTSVPRSSSWTDGPVAGPLDLFRDHPAGDQRPVDGRRQVRHQEREQVARLQPGVGSHRRASASSSTTTTRAPNPAPTARTARTPCSASPASSAARPRRDFSNDFPVMSVALPAGQTGIDAVADDGHRLELPQQLHEDRRSSRRS